MAQSNLGANKYLVANAPTNPTGTTNFVNVASAQTATNYSYVIKINNLGSSPVTITDILPAGFVASGCTVFFNGVASNPAGCPATGGPSATIGPVGGNGSIIVYITGQFTVGGQKLNAASVTDGSVTATANVDVWVDTLPPNFNIKVTKTANVATTPFGSTITYTSVISNPTTTDVNLGGIVSLFDRLENLSNSNEYAISWNWVSCVASTGSSCFSPPLPQSGAPALLAPGFGMGIFTTSPTSTNGIPVDASMAGGVLKAGGSMTVTYTVTVDSSDPCAPTPPQLKNVSYLGLGSGLGNFPDAIPGDNSADVTVTLNGLPVTCPPPALLITKVQTGPVGWGIGVLYKIKVQNISGSPVNFRYEDRERGAPANTVFNANVTTPTCVPFGCPPVTNFTPVTWIGSSPKKLFERLSNVSLTPLGTNSTITISYLVKYSAACTIDGLPVKILNEFIARGTVLSSTPYNFRQSRGQLTTLPSPATCALKVEKNWKPSPPVVKTIPLQFGVPVGVYEVKWTNTSAVFGVNMGTLLDVMHIDDPLYATVPVTFGTPSCTPLSLFSGIGGFTGGGTNVSPSGSAPQGAQAIVIKKVKFPPLGVLTCSFAVTAQRPLPTDPNCQSQGTPNLWNTAIADIDPDYNPNTPPWKIAGIEKRLPWCMNITLKKTATPTEVLPGDPVSWSISATNNGPAPNLPIGFATSDPLPAGLLPLSSGPTCVVAPGSTCNTLLLGNQLITSFNNLAVGQTDSVNFTSTSPNYPTNVQNVVTAINIGGNVYYHPRPMPNADATVTTMWPKLTKKFSQSTVFGPNVPVTLTFTITNLGYKPAVSGMIFKDTLPLGIQIGAATSVGCGPVQVTYGSAAVPYSVELTGGALPAGYSSCSFSVPVKYDRCGTFTNNNGNLVGTPVHVTPQLSATLTVACLKQVTGNGIDNPQFKGYGCALYDSGDIKCWGTGALGRIPTPLTAAPITATTFAPAEKIDAGPMHMCSITKTGKAQCWGNNSGGQLGDGTYVAKQTPSGFVKTGPTTELTNLVDISAGGFGTCAVDIGGRVWCWGRVGGLTYPPYATAVTGILSAAQVSVSNTHVCARYVATNGDALAACWGQQEFGALGNQLSAPLSVTTPTNVMFTVTPLAPLTHVRSIKAGIGYTCAELVPAAPPSSRVYCWGRNDTVGLGPAANALSTATTGSPILAPSPVLVGGIGLMNISKLTVTDSGSGRLHNCVMHNATFQTICWGTDSYNQVNGGIPLPLTPPITSGVTISAAPTLTGPLDASNGKTCAIVGSGTSALNATVQCWGNRALGRQLGDNLPTPTISTAPVNVIGVP